MKLLATAAVAFILLCGLCSSLRLQRLPREQVPEAKAAPGRESAGIEARVGEIVADLDVRHLRAWGAVGAKWAGEARGCVLRAGDVEPLAVHARVGDAAAAVGRYRERCATRFPMCNAFQPPAAKEVPTQS